MDDYSKQISLSALNSDYNGDITTTHDGLVTIKHEPQDIEEEHYPIQINSETTEFINNVPLMNHQEPTNYTERFELKECYIRLEKCDKIWETLKFIKNLQTPVINKNKNPKIAVKNVVQSQSPSPSPMLYQPTLNNGNSALPNFQFAIKSWKRLYTCTYCGKQYVDNRSLKAHLFKLHNVNPEIDSPREIPSPIEIPRPVDIPRPKEIPQFPDLPRSSPKLGKRRVDPGKPFECNTCEAKYADARSLASHSLRLHGILTEFHERWLAQQENPNDYTVEDLLKRHSCNSCGKRYSCTKSLRMHYLREHNFVLPPMRAGRRNTLGQGPMTNLIHTGDMQKHMNICTICGKKYTKNWYLRVHCLEVHGIPMVCNRTKKSFTPAVRVIKKEVLDEPPPQLQPTDPNFSLAQVKKEPQEPGVVPPVKTINKRHVCVACKREFLTISKLRVHCMALHGIVIPRIRKPYKKSIFTMNKKSASLKIDHRTQVPQEHYQHHPEAPMKHLVMSGNLNRSLESKLNTSIEMKIKPDPRMQVSTPKQVSLDRYFKSPINGEQILPKTTSLPNFTKRDKIPPKDPQDEKEVPKEPAKETVKPVPQQKTPANLIKCNLCSSNCKDIRKHYIAYHKIRYPETNVMKDLAATANDTPQEPEKQPEKVPDIKKQPPRKRRRKFITMGRKKKRKIDNTPIEHPPLEITTPDIKHSPNIQTSPIKLDSSKEILPKKESPKLPSPTKTQFKCNICGGFYATPKSLKIHRQRHRMKGETKENIHLIAHNYKNMWKSSRTPDSFNEDLDFNIGTDSRTSSNESITQSSSSTSDSIDRLIKSTTRKTYSASETTCECGRGFRDPHTMYLHKDKCPTVNKIDRDKITVARSSSDRDSGIGISITIKKKNDSYEIVSRDSGDDDKSKDSSISKDSDQMSHSSDSNFSSGVFNDRKFLDLIKGQCSKDHSVLKIEDADDDVDVDIEEDSQTNMSDSEVGKKEPKSPKVIAEEEDDDNRTVDPLDVDLYRCAVCLELFKEMESLTKHTKLHESMRVIRQECPCGKTFRGAQSFLTHVEEYHPLWLQCGYCDVTFLNSKEYYSHTCEVNKEGKEFEDFQEIICHYCSAKLRMTNFESHVTAHHFIAEKPFLCFFCKTRFSTKRQRTIHITTEHAKPNCRICGQTLRFDFVAKHEAYHQGLGFPCHTCKKAFASYKLMSSHQFEVHTRDDVKCNICKKSVTRRHFKHHMMSHTMKDKCKICNRCFHSVSMLENHIKAVHRNTYPFLKCDTCSEKFVVEQQLENHFTKDLCKRNKKVKKLSVQRKVALKTTKGTSGRSVSTTENGSENKSEDTGKGATKTNSSTLGESESPAVDATKRKTKTTTEGIESATDRTERKTEEGTTEKKISGVEGTTEKKTETVEENTTDGKAETTTEETTESAAKKVTETAEAVEETEENALKTKVKLETSANDGNHSEMEESVDMDEPLALDPSSDIDGLLEAAESTMHDLDEQNDSSEQIIDEVSRKEKTPQEETETSTEDDTRKKLNETTTTTTTIVTEPKENNSLDENSQPEKSREETVAKSSVVEKNCDAKKEENKPSEIADTLLETVANDSNEDISITDTFASDETLLIDTNNVNSTANAEPEIPTSMEIDECQGKRISESIENSNEMQVDT